MAEPRFRIDANFWIAENMRVDSKGVSELPPVVRGGRRQTQRAEVAFGDFALPAIG